MDATGLQGPTEGGDPLPPHIALQHALLGQFAAWVSTESSTSAIAEAAGRLMVRVSENVLDALLAVAGGTALNALWVRQEFDAAMGHFGVTLRDHVPERHQHEVSQVLQLRMLEAELRVEQALRALSVTPSP
jgi:hypothetical protein